MLMMILGQILFQFEVLNQVQTHFGEMPIRNIVDVCKRSSMFSVECEMEKRR